MPQMPCGFVVCRYRKLIISGTEKPGAGAEEAVANYVVIVT